MARKASRTTPNFVSQAIRGVDFERAHSSVVLGEDVRGRRRGFTIVELLIVVVVIAILAAITIVAYNGITNRSKAAAASTAAEQAAKKVMTYAVTNSDNYPTSLSDAGITDGSATYQYRVDNTANPKTFCLTATTQSTSAYVSSTNATPTSGVCAGHAASGQTLVTNLMPNPTVRTDMTGWASNWGTGANGTTNRYASGGWSDNPYYQMTWSANASVTWGGVQITSSIPADSGKTYRVSGWVRSSKAQQMFVYIRPNSYPTVSDSQGTPITVTANVWTRVTVVATIPAGVTSFTPRFERTASGNWASGDSLSVSGVIVTEGSDDYSFADGATSGWAWNGTPNNSTSTGPAI